MVVPELEGLPADIAAALRSEKININQHFSASAPVDMLCKLIWNLRKVRDADEGAEGKNKLERTWALMDFTIAAWHIVDWVFHEVDDEHRQQWAERFGRKMKDASDFGQVLCDQWPEVLACWKIAVSLKHRELRKKDPYRVLTWIENERDGKSVPGEDADWNPKIYVSGRVWAHVEFAEAITAHWVGIFLSLDLIPGDVAKDLQRRSGVDED
jgi:hypothetical protein